MLVRKKQLTGTRWRGFECDVGCQCFKLVAFEVVCQCFIEYDDASQCLVGSDTDDKSGGGDKFHVGLKVRVVRTLRCE